MGKSRRHSEPSSRMETQEDLNSSLKERDLGSLVTDTEKITNKDSLSDTRFNSV